MSSSPSQNSLLLVDDDEFLRERMSRALAARGLQVRAAAGADEALALVRESAPDMAVLDLKMPGMNGIDLLKEIKRLSPHTEIVILTGYGSIANAVEAVQAGAANYVTKPADADQVLAALKRGAPVEAAAPEAPPASDIHAPSLAEAEWNHIQQALADNDGNITRAAEQLGIPRRTLQRKLKKLAP
ncbi:Photosynthetic apparatus regulatory protein RegA [Pseudobythopirellula maris]|uniref:Photosynthetic apparatus regulatory protein RegA n=1 Tax=Pseudobythopirellula maris TaxID=2527991 RepID=A0A5C5ZPN7_9BACT|nr:response regulator [Pseudobythopirellula maris]TWT88867.1 Photosynthetic apparatus regulatory protein RegA [Pseudobythopirellula maris]